MTEWISIKKRFPKFGTIVKAKDFKGELYDCYYPEEEWDPFWIIASNDEVILGITYWMPIKKQNQRK